MSPAATTQPAKQLFLEQMLALATDKKPLPDLNVDEIDSCCLQFEMAERAMDAANAQFETAKLAMIAIVRAQGHVPAGAEESKRILGRRSIATITTAKTTTVREEGVAELEEYLGANGLDTLFDQLFVTNTKHTLAKSAHDGAARREDPQARSYADRGALRLLHRRETQGAIAEGGICHARQARAQAPRQEGGGVMAIVVLSQVNEAKPNKMFTEEQRSLVRFLTYSEAVPCSMCGRRSKRHWTMLCSFAAAEFEGFTLKTGRVLLPFAPVCTKHPLTTSAIGKPGAKKAVAR